MAIIVYNIISVPNFKGIIMVVPKGAYRAT